MVAGWRYLSGSANWIWRASLPSRNLFLTSPSESKVRGSRFSIGNIHRRTAEKNCSRGSNIRNLLQVGMFALSLVKHSVSSSCSDLHICLLPLLLHSPISTRLDCSAGLFSFRYGRNKLSYCPISSLLLKIRFCQKSVLLIIGVKISSHDSPCVVDSEWECG